MNVGCPMGLLLFNKVGKRRERKEITLRKKCQPTHFYFKHNFCKKNHLRTNSYFIPVLQFKTRFIK